ncbi:MAG: hypothetical protein K0R92_2491 [Lachnospiraceae bacterium]|nr:hypothetical protein [Lachnospiraceae bacterium]
MATTFIKKHTVGSILESAVYGQHKIENHSKKGSIIESKIFGKTKKDNKTGYNLCGKK